MKPKVLIFSALFFLFALANDIAAQKHETEPANILSYKIKPVPQNDRTDLEISVEFKAEKVGALKIKLPTDNFGTPDLHKFVTRFAGEKGTLVTAGENEREKIVTAARDGNVALRYTISYDPKVMDDFAFAPNTGAKYFHVAGCQWLLHIGDDAQKRIFRIEIIDAPENWKFYSSKAANAEKLELETSYNELISAPVGGGEYAHQFRVKTGRVSVFVHGEYDIPRKQIYSSIERIVRLQRRWFDDYSQREFTIAVAPRSGVVAGYAPSNSFILFVKRDTSAEQLNRIIAHELFHTWLPNKIEIVQDKKFSGIRYEWFTEGFTDYFARKILTEAGLMNETRFADSINQDILSVADNPHSSKSYDELVELVKANKYDSAAKKLAYFRGALIALDWDARIKKRDKNNDLSAFVRELYKLAQKTGGKISEQDFYDLVAAYGIDAKADFEKYIMRGGQIAPDALALGKNYHLSEMEKPSFDPGFSLDETFKTRKISGVKENGAAYKAGLRDGMEFISVENSSRFSNAWSAEKPLAVSVKLEGKIRRFEYFPHGQMLKLKLFALKTKP